MKTYEIALTRKGADNTTHRARAASIEEAQRQICAAENLPLSAVQWWRVVPTAKQIAKTKSLLRGI